MKRTPLRERKLPDYSKAEELTNMITHIVGGAMGVAALVLCVVFSAIHGNGYGVVTSVVYGVSMIALYAVSSIYHGLHDGMGKRVMQVIDHCTIYFLISGTYTVVLLSAIRRLHPGIAWGIFGFEWLMVAIATALTAIDLKKYSVFSMICYIGMGWAIIPFAEVTMQALGTGGFVMLLLGGIAYTIGAVLYGIGSKKHWMHSVFHVFVLIGSLLHFLTVLLYAI